MTWFDIWYEVEGKKHKRIIKLTKKESSHLVETGMGRDEIESTLWFHLRKIVGERKLRTSGFTYTPAINIIKYEQIN